MLKTLTKIALSMTGGPKGLILYILHQWKGVKQGDMIYAKIAPTLDIVEPIIGSKSEIKIN